MLAAASTVLQSFARIRNCVVVHTAEGMALSRFAKSQDVICQIVAVSQEESWRSPTLVCRLALADGSHIECQAVGEAKACMEKLPMFTALSMVVPGKCLRPYTAAERTGIRAELCLRLQFPPKVNRCVQSFDLESDAEGTFVLPADLDQQDGVFNVAGGVGRYQFLTGCR